MKVLRELTIDKLHVRVLANRKEMGTCAGREAADCIKEMLEKQPSVCVMFAAAPSQNETLAILAADEEHYSVYRLRELLPQAFVPSRL